jgi:hypothetical protein
MARLSEIDPQKAKDAILGYCKRKGALVAGVADLAMIDKIAPEGHRPKDIMPRVKSVIALGVGGQTQGSWNVAPKALTYFGSTERRGYGIAYGCAFFIENTFGARAIYCPPDMDPEAGPRTPLQDLKLHAELAGIRARSPATSCCIRTSATCISPRCSPSSSCRRTSRWKTTRAPRRPASTCTARSAARRA